MLVVTGGGGVGMAQTQVHPEGESVGISGGLVPWEEEQKGPRGDSELGTWRGPGSSWDQGHTAPSRPTGSPFSTPLRFSLHTQPTSGALA